MSGLKAKSADTLIVERRLRETTPGDIITYDELSKVLGRDVRKHCVGCLRTARNTLQGESIFFDTLSGIGLKRLDNDEACKATGHYLTRSRRAARRGIKHISHVPYEGLTPETQREHLTLSTQLGAIDLFSSGKATARIESAISGVVPLAIGETLKLFGG
jgi:hypothetical protein